MSRRALALCGVAMGAAMAGLLALLGRAVGEADGPPPWGRS